MLLFFLLAAPANGQTNTPPMAAMTPVEPSAPTPPPNPSSSAAGLISSMDALNDQTKLTSGDLISYRVTEEQKQPVELAVLGLG